MEGVRERVSVLYNEIRMSSVCCVYDVYLHGVYGVWLVCITYIMYAYII